MAGERVLVVDDEPRYRRLIQFNLESQGYQVMTAPTGEKALDTLAMGSVDLVVLDVMLPGMNGFEVCADIRETSTVPIIMLTARGGQDDIVMGLGLGADDYVAKPFSAQELMARVDAVLRRARPPALSDNQTSFTLGDLRVNLLTRRVTVKGREVRLSLTENRLLHHFLSNAGKTLTQDEILDSVWGQGYEGEHRVVRVTVHRLRQKLGDDTDNPRFIATVPGVGYLFGPAT